MKDRNISLKMLATLLTLACLFLFDPWLYHFLLGPAPQIPSQEPQAQHETARAKTIYLTFDMDMNDFMYWKFRRDGTEWYDPALFAYLEANHIPATFFVSGLFAKAYPGLMKNVAADENFSFQNHAYDESSFVPNCYWLPTLTTDGEKTWQIETTQNLIFQTTGRTATYFRFPGICHDTQNDALVEGLGFRIDDGTIVSGDPFNENTEAIVAAVVKNARDGAVAVMHVGGHNAPKSLDALEQIVPELESEGYSFAAL